MRNKILAASGILGAVLTAVALIGYSAIEANAGTISVPVKGPIAETTKARASCLPACMQGTWKEMKPNNVVEFQSWSGGPVVLEIDGELVPQPPEVQCYITEQITTSEEVFSALDITPGGVSGRCPRIHDTDKKTVTYCIKRGSVLLTADQIACVTTCAKAVDQTIHTVKRVASLAGPPRTIEITRGVNLSPHDYAACRSTVPPTCARGKAE